MEFVPGISGCSGIRRVEQPAHIGPVVRDGLDKARDVPGSCYGFAHKRGFVVDTFPPPGRPRQVLDLTVSDGVCPVVGQVC